MTKNFQVRLSQLLNSLSYALDVAENRYYDHSRRTAYIAYSLAKEMELEKGEVMNIYYGALIHDIGMAGQLSKFTIKEIHYNDRLLKEHCILGYKILEDFPLQEKIREYVLYHHENWDGTGPFGLKGDRIPLGAQIIHLADYFELNFIRDRDFNPSSYNTDKCYKWFKKYEGIKFNKSLTHIFMDLIRRERFWLDLQKENLKSILNIIAPQKGIILDTYDLHKVSKAFSLLIDAKSKFTYNHSQGVSRHVNAFAKYLGYNEIMVEKLTIAADLHDIGKFIIPLEILDKPGKLTPEEFLTMKSHAYYTKLILKQIEGLEKIAEWAGNHHEKLNGEGYPEKLDVNSLTQEDQIIAFADIYQALTEDRPYRPGMSPKKSINIMEGMVNKGYLCRKLLGDFKQLVL